MRALLHGLGGIDLAEEDLVARGHTGIVRHAQGGARVALRIEVDHEDRQSLHGERGGDVHRRGGLTDPALLIGDREDATLARLRQCVGIARMQDLGGAMSSRADRGVDGGETVEGYGGEVVLGASGFT